MLGPVSESTLPVGSSARMIDGSTDQGASDGGPLALAAGELARPVPPGAPAPPFECDAPRARRRRRDAPVEEPVGDVLERGEGRDQEELLEHEPDRGARIAERSGSASPDAAPATRTGPWSAAPACLRWPAASTCPTPTAGDRDELPVADAGSPSAARAPAGAQVLLARRSQLERAHWAITTRTRRIPGPVTCTRARRTGRCAPRPGGARRTGRRSPRRSRRRPGPAARPPARPARPARHWVVSDTWTATPVRSRWRPGRRPDGEPLPPPRPVHPAEDPAVPAVPLSVRRAARRGDPGPAPGGWTARMTRPPRPACTGGTFSGVSGTLTTRRLGGHLVGLLPGAAGDPGGAGGRADPYRPGQEHHLPEADLPGHRVARPCLPALHRHLVAQSDISPGLVEQPAGVAQRDQPGLAAARPAVGHAGGERPPGRHPPRHRDHRQVVHLVQGVAGPDARPGPGSSVYVPLSWLMSGRVAA